MYSRLMAFYCVSYYDYYGNKLRRNKIRYKLCHNLDYHLLLVQHWIKNIELFFEFGKQNYDYILCGLGEAIIIPVIFGGLGIILYYYHKEGILSLILSGLPVMYCSFTLISYQWENQFLLAIIINLLILVIVFCLTGKKYMKYKILFIVLGGVLGFFYFV